MPKQPMKYENNIIYKIQHETIDELIYVGSTCDFVKRKCRHKNTCNNETRSGYNFKLYQMIRENGGWDSFTMTMVSKYPCEDYLEARQEEERIRRELNANMNSQRCFVTEEDIKVYKKAYREEHKKEISIRDKKYYEEHTEKIKEYRRKYCDEHNERIKEYMQVYNEEHSEKIKENKKKYYQEHSEKLKEKVECECGCVITTNSITRHKQTDKHKRLILEKLI